jgi:energy-coupling factor transporter ATP-binding protein EcfA2
MRTQKNIASSFKKMRKVSLGARFYKADLHFHTPASEDARGKNRYNFNPYKTKYPVRGRNFKKHRGKVKKIQEKILANARKVAAKIVKRFVEEKLSLVAVTDHNAIGTLWRDAGSKSGVMDLKAPTWYEIIDDEAGKINAKARKKVITILPGVEISCTGIHILAVFPPHEPRRAIHFVICDLLEEMGLAIEEWGKNPKVGKRSVIDAVNLIQRKGGIAIIAHIDGSDQALLKLYKLNSGAMKNVFCNEKLSAVEIVNPSKFSRRDKKLKTTIKNWIKSLRVKKELAPLAYLQGSDAHDLKSIGKRFTFLKMTLPSFAAFKIAVCIPASRARISALHKKVTRGLYIYGVEIKNKYFGRRLIRFNRHLNCVAGEKESGKSSIFRLMEKAVRPDSTKIKGNVKLFVEKIIDSNPYHYAFCNNNKSDLDLYSINKAKGTAAGINASRLKELMIEPKFYHSDKIEKVISSRDDLNAFLIKHFGKPTRRNVADFNRMFSIANFLELKEERLLYAEGDNGKYKLRVNVNWHAGKAKMADFFKLRNSLRRIAIISMIVVSGSFGPLIIDAPESNLDNEDIAHFLVPIIKKYKDLRQIILFTDNPILIVNSDPENYILLSTKGKKLAGIKSGFSIDEKDQKEHLINLMEGGLKSFKKRAIRYGARG